RPGDLAAQVLGLARDRASVLTQNPRGEERQARVLGHEDAVLDLATAAVRALHPPGRVAADLDPRLADRIADLPGRPPAVLVDLELGRQAEVALAARREADLAADPGDPEGALVLDGEVVA